MSDIIFRGFGVVLGRKICCLAGEREAYCVLLGCQQRPMQLFDCIRGRLNLDREVALQGNMMVDDVIASGIIFERDFRFLRHSKFLRQALGTPDIQNDHEACYKYNWGAITSANDVREGSVIIIVSWTGSVARKLEGEHKWMISSL